MYPKELRDFDTFGLPTCSYKNIHTYYNSNSVYNKVHLYFLRCPIFYNILLLFIIYIKSIAALLLKIITFASLFAGEGKNIPTFF